MKNYSINISLLVLSICIIILSVFFIDKLSYPLMYLIEPEVNGQLVVSSPYDLLPYYNFVSRCGLSVAGILFFIAMRPLMTHLFSNRKIIGIFLGIIVTPVYILCVIVCSTIVNRMVLK
jgi:hypothetical protein